MDAIVIVLIAVGVAGALCCFWARMDYLERKRREAAVQRGKDFMTDHMAKHGYRLGETWPTQTVPLPSIPVLPIPEYQDYQLEPEAAHLPTWTPTVSHYPDQDHGHETTSQHDFDAISDGGDCVDGDSCDGGCGAGDD